jgi:hypothetical protein
VQPPGPFFVLAAAELEPGRPQFQQVSEENGDHDIAQRTQIRAPRGKPVTVSRDSAAIAGAAWITGLSETAR